VLDARLRFVSLGKVAAAIDRPPYNKHNISWSAQIIARLHVRGKSNEAHAKSLRNPVEEDAELTLHALGFAIRDLGWAT